ncbi:RNA-binding protein Cwf29 [Friedmanniomyces endolithicus]|uniref:RNA-binding protein Cwf29 n=1 Tax=Rachicladosporium monterosium TaxID=1507873 RepID=A0ABR0LEA0_9PEZI|nr:RNA-binding protein Cwf29 [Friedmanniomyces endolithicus]KAK5147533.1 RNA-binding protein Cwf29 [Rachicladosporium monterosium]KAK0795353.1 RNA-binding protein Cwf29 [Friedmanniomyces endolithicus]KAK0800624.1 RNA-binding protein Cwf29 [Friedmanniomyces endolithicus]KAK0801695.1 RNA-binding protein Cwf29 [Friedmanniomyces endolithicus]
MQSIKQVQRLNDTELEKVVPSNASWHTDYRDTAYIYIGGLPFELSEGDILTIFSQYGNPVHINLVRDKETGKSRGYCFLKYEDQRSCDLAVDNLSGAGVMGRLLSVDHTRYKKKDGEVEGVGDVEEVADETDEEGQSRSKRRRTDSLSEGEQERPLIQEESELAKLRREMDDDDPMKAYMIKEKQVEVEEALKALAMSKHKGKDSGRDRGHKHRHRYHRSEHEHADKEQGVKRDGHKSTRDKAPDEQATMRQSREPRRNRSTTPEDSRDNDRHRRR